jgi:iron complex outermembrane receptor protein
MAFRMKSIPLAVLQIIGSGALTAMVALPAAAQEADTSTPGVARVVVTGSYISRADKETPSPVQVITAEDIKKTGYTSVSDVLRDITSNGQGTLSQGFNRAFAGGASGISLRGLTVGATLVLIDGHRMAPYPLSDDGQRPFVDISNIPFDAVERIEILKDGASAAYGSDAIAGVVNVILKKSFVGTSVAADSGTSQAGGGATNHLSITQGWGDLDTDGYTGYASLEYRHQNAIMASQRTGHGWSTTDWSPQGGLNVSPGAVNDLVSLPNTLTPYLYNPTGAGGGSNANNFSFYPGCASLAALKANQCTFTDPWAQIQPETENINLLGSFTKKLGSDWEFNVKASMLESKDHVETTPAAYPHGSYAGNTALGPGVIPHQVGVINSFLVPANYPGNTTGSPARVYGYLTDIGGRVDDIDSKSYRLVGELTGTIGKWDVAFSAGYTKIDTNQAYSGYVDRAALYAALTSANPYKITGGNSAAANAAIAPHFGVTQTDELDFAEGRGTIELLKLDGGSLAGTIGTSFVHKKLNAPDAAEFASGQIPGNTAYALGQQNDAAAYFGLFIPVTKQLEFDAAGRFDHYDTYGNSSTPKVEFKYTPSDIITLRGTYSRGFRAPGSAENGTAGSSFGFNQVNDPLLCPGGNPKAAGNVAAYCLFGPAYVQTTTPNLDPEKSKSGTLGAILEPIKGWSTTLDYYTIEIDGQIVTAASLPGYVPNFVRGVPQPQVISDGNGGTYVGTPAYGQILYATSGYVNAGSTKTTGLDLNSSYRFNLGEFGKLKVALDWTHMISYDLTTGGVTYALAGTHGPTVISGDTGNPRNRAQLTLSYDKGPLNVTTTTNWIDSYSVLDPSTGPGANDTCETSLQNSNVYFENTTYPTKYCKVDSFVSTDLTLSYKFNKNLTVHGTVLNLFNAQAPIDAQTYGGTSIAAANGNLPYNPSLHQAGAVGRFFSVGAAYKF